MGNCLPQTPCNLEPLFDDSPTPQQLLTHESIAVEEFELLCGAIKGKDFSMEGERYLARVVEVYDGDTIRVVIFRRNEKQQHRVRMLGYDSPEKKPRLNATNRDAEKVAALAARDILIAKISNPRQLVTLECRGFDKYGRLLGVVIHKNGTNINEWMIKHGYGVKYGGGTKAAFVSREHDQ